MSRARWGSKYHTLEIKWITKIPFSSNMLVKDNMVGEELQLNILTDLLQCYVLGGKKNICPEMS